MIKSVQNQWSKISGGLLVVAMLGVGGATLYQHVARDCCGQGASCCHPGASCCNGRHKIAAR